MENEINKDLQENPELSEADLEAQKWLEELLAATEPEPLPEPEDTPSAEPEPAEPETEPGDDHWFQQLESPLNSAPQIDADPYAVASHEMANMADMELEKIMSEAKSEEWDMEAIEQEILSESMVEAFPAADIRDAQPADLYTDGGQDPDIPIDTERKVRPKRKGGYGLLGLPHLLSTAIWAAICIGVGITLGRLLWGCASDILAFGRPNQDVQITITATDTLDTITDKLHDAGLIKYPQLFKFYADLTGVEEKGKISQGTFTLNTGYDYHALVGGMSSSSSYRTTTEVVIPEGFTCAQIFAKLEEAGVCSAAELEQYCIESEFSSYWFLEDVPKGTKYCLEGFLFPNTYQFYVNATPKEVFIKMLGGFENQFDEEMVAQLEALNETIQAMYTANGAAEKYQPLTVHDVVIVASMIEKETAYSGESPTIASVIYNRITDPHNYPTLDIDATLVYGLGKNELTAEDLAMDHPYNTYKKTGLPPGAISNPGEFSLKAALNPSETNYHFYALDPTAEITSHRFFKTYQEHKAFLDSLE